LTVTASVTKEIKGLAAAKTEEERAHEDTGEANQTDPGRAGAGRTDGSKRQNDTTPTLALGQRKVTHVDSKERDSGTAPNERPELTGKLCRRVMALIRWQCGADGAVDACMVRALEGWLRKRGISIYTDLV
jgi:hypothetical protein